MTPIHSVALVLSAAASGSGGLSVTVAVWVSIAALVTSLAALMTGIIRDRRLLLLRIHEYLTTIDQQRGRREIHRMAEADATVDDLSEDQRAQCNHALAALNTMAIYYDRNWVSRDALLQFWAEPVLRLMPAAQSFLAYRDANRRRTWPELRSFADAARTYARKQGWDELAAAAADPSADQATCDDSADAAAPQG